MRFTANVWVYRDVLIRPGDPFEAPEKLSDAWIEYGPSNHPNIGDAVLILHEEEHQDEPAQISPEKPRRGRPPRDK